jgi:hypothetical protein
MLGYKGCLQGIKGNNPTTRFAVYKPAAKWWNFLLITHGNEEITITNSSIIRIS